MNYIQRTKTGIVLQTKNQSIAKDIGLNRYLNLLCIDHLSTLDGRQKAARKLLNKTANIPIYINQEVLLFPNQSMRLLDVILINYIEIYDIHKKDNHTKIVFKDLDTLTIKQSYVQMKNQFRLCSQLMTHIENKKKVFTL